jgi:(S)-ureidoglycine aminohydrolase
MKTLVFFLTVFCASAAMAQVDSVTSGVYHWGDLAVAATDTGARRAILEGSTTPLAYLEIHTATLDPGMASPGQAHDDLEELVIVKDGALNATLGEEHRVLGPGSVAVVLPGDEHGFENAGDAPVTYYVFRYRAKTPVDLERGRDAGGSFLVDWDDVTMQETETGGRRQHFDRPTAMFERFEMHVSTLNEGLTNHAAHTHRAEEFVLVIKGQVEMLVGEAYYKASAGDLYFLASLIPHALNNVGSGPTEYFAFQWQ